MSEVAMQELTYRDRATASAAAGRAAPSDPLIHVGYHKTGSSWLQARLFGNSESGFHSPWSPTEYIERIIIANPFAYDAQSVRQYFWAGCAEAADRDLVPVLTHEMLSGNPWKGGQFNSHATAQRLHETYPAGRILLVIREQSSMISSLYRHHVRVGLSQSIARYLQPSPQDSGFEPIFRWQYVEYHWLISYYQELFGPDRVLVLPFELLCRDCNEFARRICQFSGLANPPPLPFDAVNSGYSALVVDLKRRVNPFVSADRAIGQFPWRHRFAERLFHRLNHYVPASIAKRSNRRLQQLIRKAMGNHYQESNRRTSELTGLDLHAFGYVM